MISDRTNDHETPRKPADSISPDGRSVPPNKKDDWITELEQEIREIEKKWPFLRSFHSLTAKKTRHLSGRAEQKIKFIPHSNVHTLRGCSTC